MRVLLAFADLIDIRILALSQTRLRANSARREHNLADGQHNLA
jgi:hypothetical protein